MQEYHTNIHVGNSSASASNTNLSRGEKLYLGFSYRNTRGMSDLELNEEKTYEKARCRLRNHSYRILIVPRYIRILYRFGFYTHSALNHRYVIQMISMVTEGPCAD